MVGIRGATISTGSQHISLAFSPSSSPHMSKHPSHEPLGYRVLKSAAICFRRGVGGEEVSACTQHLGSLGIPAPLIRVICRIAPANTRLLVLWQLFASQAQSLLLMTTVAMPVFSKKNETVSATWALLCLPPAELEGCCRPLWGFRASAPLTDRLAFRDHGRLWTGCADDNLSVEMIACHFL